jgi:thiamine-monophosphate kinase
MSSEFARIAQLEALFRRSSPDISLAIGDDCAVLAPSAHRRVWTVDSAVENVHFSRAFMALGAIAYRSFMAAASDVAAMGGRAVGALSALTLPSSFSDDELMELASGLVRAADACACPIVGGNLARGRELSLTTTVLGECATAVATRAGARVGDGLFVSGPLGGAALGLSALSRGHGDDARYRAAIACFLAPRARLDLAHQLANVASAAIDVSDGLAQDLAHLCEASGVGALVEADRLPLLADAAALARELDRDAIALALGGGEDYELLFTAAPDQVPAALGTRIGTIVNRDRGLSVLDAQGRALPLAPGFDHFATR